MTFQNHLKLSANGRINFRSLVKEFILKPRAWSFVVFPIIPVSVFLEISMSQDHSYISRLVDDRKTLLL